MIGALIVTHGNVAAELLKATEAIEGHLEHFEAVGLDWGDPVEHATERIREALERFRPHDVIIFTDMFGGTPSNLALSFHEPERVEIITGVNLPMLVKFAALRAGEQSLSTSAQIIRDRGARSIRVASEVLDRDRSEGGGNQ